MTGPLRVFVNATPEDVPAGSDVRAALERHDPAMAAGAAAGTAMVSDARGIALPLDAPLAAGSILRVVVRARRGPGDGNADA
jgi:hypothetical protein